MSDKLQGFGLLSQHMPDTLARGGEGETDGHAQPGAVGFGDGPLMMDSKECIKIIFILKVAFLFASGISRSF